MPELRIDASIGTNAKVLTVGIIDGAVYLWAMVDPTTPRIMRKVHIICTGDECPCRYEDYVGTIQDGVYIYHVFVSN